MKRPAGSAGSVTLRDVADAADTSVATVSHAINGTRYVSPQARARVLAAIERLGYKGNSIARSLRLGRTATLGLVISDIENPLFTRLASRVQVAASAGGYQVIFANTDENGEREREVIEALDTQRVDGIILVPVARGNVEWLVRQRMPFTVVNRSFAGINVPQVATDDFLGAQMGVAHLWDLGHRRIGIIRGDIGRSTTTTRLAGIRDALERRGQPLDDALVVGADPADGDVCQGFMALMALRPRPTAVFALSNWALVTAIAGLERARLACPGDVSLVGYGITSPFWMGTSSVTMVEQPVDAMAQASVQQLLSRLEHGQDGTSTILLPRLVVGRSTAAPGGALPAPAQAVGRKKRT